MKTDSILIGTNTGQSNGDSEEVVTVGGKWEDEEERRFYEDIQDLKDFVPSSVLGVEGETEEEDSKETERERAAREKEEVRKLEEELEKLSEHGSQSGNGDVQPTEHMEDEYVISKCRAVHYILILLSSRLRRWAHRGRKPLRSPLSWHLKGLHNFLLPFSFAYQTLPIVF